MIAPTHIVRNGKTAEIIETNDEYIIDGFIINYFVTPQMQVSKVTSVSLFGGKHPNADEDTRVFCLPPSMKYKELNKQYISDVRKTIAIWNLDNCHFVPNPHHYKTR